MKSSKSVSLPRKWKPFESLSVGEVGYFVANIKTISDVSVGDTFTNALHGRTHSPARVSTGETDGVLRTLSRGQ